MPARGRSWVFIVRFAEELFDCANVVDAGGQGGRVRELSASYSEFADSCRVWQPAFFIADAGAPQASFGLGLKLRFRCLRCCGSDRRRR